jgi:hypothetical protein
MAAISASSLGFRAISASSLGFPGGDQAEVEGAEDVVVADRDQCRGRPRSSWPTPAGKKGVLSFGQGLRSGGVLGVGPCPWRELDPGMSAAVVDGVVGRRKAGIGEGADGDAHGRVLVAFFGVEQVGPADGAEAELESGAVVADADVLGCGADDLIGGGEGGERREDAAGPALAGNAVADADAERLALDLDAQLAAGTGRRSRTHYPPPGMSFAAA